MLISVIINDLIRFQEHHVRNDIISVYDNIPYLTKSQENGLKIKEK